MLRNKTRLVHAGSVGIGADSKVSIQSMWKEPLAYPLDSVEKRIAKLKSIGCSLLRFSVPNPQQAELLGNLAKTSEVGLVADIHFDYKLALQCLDYPIAKLRINPGNIGASWKVREVAAKAKDKAVPIRIGVNSGSLPAVLRKEPDIARAMVQTAQEEIELLESQGFTQIIVSLKASSIEDTVRANSDFAAQSDIPVHLGLTEAGPLVPGIVKSSIALYRLLHSGIGNTVRISLSDSCEMEVRTAKEILLASGISLPAVRLIACPKCGRCSFDTHAFLSQVEDFLLTISKDITIAVMGCVVNGPGEASHADIGITGSGNAVLLFKEGKRIAQLPMDQAVKMFKEEVENL